MEFILPDFRFSAARGRRRPVVFALEHPVPIWHQRPMSTFRTNAVAAGLMMASMAAFTINDAFMKLLADDWPFFQTLFVRSFGWVAAVSQNEVDQVVAARFVMLLCAAITTALIVLTVTRSEQVAVKRLLIASALAMFGTMLRWRASSHR